MVPPAGGGRGGAGAEGAGCCQLGGGEGSCWPANPGPSGGLGQTLLGSWAKPTSRGCGGLAAGGGGKLVSPPTLTTRPCPPIPFGAHGQPFAGHGCCCSLAACGCPSSYPMSYQAMLAGGLAKQPEVPEPWWA